MITKLNMVTRLKIEPTKALSFVSHAKFTRCIMKTINVKFINRKEKIIMLVERTNQLIIEVNDIKEYMFNNVFADLFDGFD